MKRDLRRLAKSKFDVLVIGGGITGACVAWDATLRGLRVALIEKGDFGGATSANSLKMVHGGLRYLQDANPGLVRKMVRERQTLLRIAPHLVHPLPVVMPTYHGNFMRSKLVLGTAVKLNDLLSFDRNWGSDPQKVLPNGRVLSRAACLDLLPGLDGAGVSGGVLWYDGQMYNSERLLLSFVLSAAAARAQAVNYVTATGFLQEDGRVTGVRARDELSGVALEIRARLVVNATGPWVDDLLGRFDPPLLRHKFYLSTAMNLVTRQILRDCAVGLSSRYARALPDGSTKSRSRVLFVAPWHGYSLVGTRHAPYDGDVAGDWVTEEIIRDFVAEVNQAYPGAALRREDVYQVHRGFLPATADSRDRAGVRLIREGQVTDHATENGVDGLVTVVGVKYTTARHVAEKAVDLVFTKLGRPSPRCQTAHTQLYGGQISRFDHFITQAMEEWPYELPPSHLRRLLYNYGSAWRQLLPYWQQDPDLGQPLTAATPLTKAEVLHGVRQEMAQKLSDVVLRRTELGLTGKPDEVCLQACARIMAAELGWDRSRIFQEIEEMEAVYGARDQK